MQTSGAMSVLFVAVLAFLGATQGQEFLEQKSVRGLSPVSETIHAFHDAKKNLAHTIANAVIEIINDHESSDKEGDEVEPTTPSPATTLPVGSTTTVEATTAPELGTTTDAGETTSPSSTVAPASTTEPTTSSSTNAPTAASGCSIPPNQDCSAVANINLAQNPVYSESCPGLNCFENYCCVYQQVN